MVPTSSSALDTTVQVGGFITSAPSRPLPPVSPAQTPPGLPTPTSVKAKAQAHTISFQLVIFGCSLHSALDAQSCWPRMFPPQGPDVCSSLPRAFFLGQTQGHPFPAFRSPLSSVLLSVACPNHLCEIAAPASQTPHPSSLLGFSLFTQSDVPHVLLLCPLKVWLPHETVSPVSAEVNARVAPPVPRTTPGTEQGRDRGRDRKSSSAPKFRSRMHDITHARNF